VETQFTEQIRGTSIDRSTCFFTQPCVREHERRAHVEMERNPSALSSSPHNGISRKHRGRRAAGSGESATASPRARDQVRQENRRGRGAMSWQAYVDEHLLCDIDGQTSASPPRRRRHPRPRRRCLGAARCLPTGPPSHSFPFDVFFFGA
jgi:hypothetical protein